VQLEVTSPYIYRIWPSKAAVGDQISLYGGNLGTVRGTSYVSFGGVRPASSDYVSWANTLIVLKIPAGAFSGSLEVVTSGGESGEMDLEVEGFPVLALPSTGALGHAPPTVTQHPQGVGFAFNSIGRDLVLTYELADVGDDEIALYINGRLLYDVRASTTWTQWFSLLSTSNLTSGRNVVEFRHVRNGGRTTGYEAWQLRNVALWKPYNAKWVASEIVTTVAPEVLGLQEPYPSPFNSSVTIPYTIEDAGRVTIGVYNVAGQEVVRILDADRPAGGHEVVWDGRASGGDMAGSGSYWVVLQAGAMRSAERLLLVR